MAARTFNHITIQPADDNGACEVWGQYEASYPGLGTFDTDGIYGHLYHIGSFWVFLNEQGHPTMVFSSVEELAGWLQSKAPSLDWAETYRQPGDRGPRQDDTQSGTS